MPTSLWSVGTFTMEAFATVGLLRLQALKGHWLEWERREACWSELGRLLCLLAGGATHQALRRLALGPPPFSSWMLLVIPPFHTKEN